MTNGKSPQVRQTIVHSLSLQPICCGGETATLREIKRTDLFTTDPLEGLVTLLLHAFLETQFPASSNTFLQNNLTKPDRTGRNEFMVMQSQQHDEEEQKQKGTRHIILTRRDHTNRAAEQTVNRIPIPRTSSRERYRLMPKSGRSIRMSSQAWMSFAL